MDYVVRPEGDGVVARLDGKMTMRDHDAFQGLVSEVVAAPGRSVTLDLSGLDFIDSAGLGFILIARERTGDAGKSLSLRRPQPHIRRMLDLGEFALLVPIQY